MRIDIVPSCSAPAATMMHEHIDTSRDIVFEYIYFYRHSRLLRRVRPRRFSSVIDSQ